MKRSKLSIITPCFNSAMTIEDTLRSVEKECDPDIEHIIIDGGSTDSTLDIAYEYADRVPYEVSIVSEEDEGIYDAMNKGICMASGELVGIINSDDWYEHDVFERIREAYSGAMYEVIYGMIRTYSEDKLKTVEFYHHDFLLDRMINHPGCFVTAKTYRDFGLFDLKYRSSADYAWMKNIADRDVVFTPVYEVLANVRCGGMSGSNIGFRETLKLQYEWGRVSTAKYIAYTLKSHIGDLIKGK